jgi:uncharacterized protein
MLLAALLLTACVIETTQSTTPQANETEPTPTEIANPSAKYCAEQGGTYTIVTNDDGSQDGECTLANGTVCPAWAYMREECP